MISVFLATFSIILIAVLAMSIGVIVAGKRIKGTCGGLNDIKGLENACDLCTKPCAKRKKALEQLQQ